MKFLKYFTLLDLYGKRPSFTINGQSEFRTVFGTIISIITYILIMCFLFIEVNDIFYHSNPTLLTSTEINYDPSPLNLTEQNFIITLALQNPDYTNYINESIYTINASLSSTILLENGKYTQTLTPLQIIKCSEYNFQFLNTYWNNLDLNELYCLTNHNIEIRGTIKNNIWNVLYIHISKCINTTYNNFSCKSNEVIEERLKGGYIGIFMSDIKLEPNNFKNPAQFYGKNLFTSISSNKYTDYWIYLKDLKIITDDGLFFKNKKSQLFFSIDNFETNKDERNVNNFLNVIIRRSLKREIYERTYIKIQQAIGNTCGIIKAVTIIGDIISYFFQKLLYQSFILQFINFNHENKQFFIANKNKLNDKSNSKIQFFKGFNEDYEIKNKKKFKSAQSFPFLFLKENNRKSGVNKIIINNHNNESSSKRDIQYSNNLNLLKDKKTNTYSIDFKTFKKKLFKVKTKIFFTPILCDKKCLKRINKIFNRYNLIKYCFDIVFFIKLQYEIALMKNCLFDEKKNKEIKYIYKLDYNIFNEKEGYDKIFKSIEFIN